MGRQRWKGGKKKKHYVACSTILRLSSDAFRGRVPCRGPRANVETETTRKNARPNGQKNASESSKYHETRPRALRRYGSREQSPETLARPPSTAEAPHLRGQGGTAAPQSAPKGSLTAVDCTAGGAAAAMPGNMPATGGRPPTRGCWATVCMPGKPRGGAIPGAGAAATG